MVIQNIQDFLAKEEIREANLLEITSEVVDEIDSDNNINNEGCEVNKLTVENFWEGLR